MLHQHLEQPTAQFVDDIVFGVHAGGRVEITVEQHRARQIAQFDGSLRWPGICAWWSARSHFGEVAIDML